MAAAALTALALASTSAPSEPAVDETERRALDAYAKLPLSFIPNRGQTDKRVRYYAQGPGLGVYLTADKAVLSFTEGERGTALELRFAGANPDAQLEAGRRTAGKVNYLRGSEHQTGLATYGQVAYRKLWPGIDMVFRGQGGKLKYEFHVAPGADPSKIRLAYKGAEGLSLGAAGSLLISTPLGTLRDSRPRSYQRVRGRHVPVGSRYAVDEGAGAYGFALAAHDPRRPLVIDPGLEYSTFLGGANADSGAAIAVDAGGSAYVTGSTGSRFPTTPGAFDTSHNGFGDVMVTKLNPAGSALVYSTYLGGSGQEYSDEIVLDASGSAYVTGYTESSNFPTTVGAFDTGHNGSNDAFVTKLNPAGSALEYSTYLGGDASDRSLGIAVDASGSASVAGYTESSNFPTTVGAFDTGHSGPYDAFVTKLNPVGSALAYSTYLGGIQYDFGNGIAVDASGSAYVMGHTDSSDFPTTTGAFDTGYNGGYDAFVTKLNPAGSALAYSTYLGGSRFETYAGIALDSSGNAYVTGETESADFPTTPGAFDTSLNEIHDAVVTKLNSTGSALAYSTYLGSDTRFDSAHDIAVDASGSAHVLGETRDNFPTTPGAFSSSSQGDSYGAFLTKLNPTGSGLAYSTFLGGEGWVGAVALDASGSAYVTGTTGPDFPTTPGAFDTSFNGGGGDGFVTKLPPLPASAPSGYPRPKSATLLDASLVPAYKGCTAPNREHGPPLASDSCNPPVQASHAVALGTPDSNGKPVKGKGRVVYQALTGDPTTQADEADVRITVAIDDVYELLSGTLADYAGELIERTALRITDKLNPHAGGGSPAATVSDISLGVTVPCTATADSTQGASCGVATSADALAPGAVSEGKRAVWALGQVQVDYEGDPDWVGDNTPFMVQGVFVP